MHPDEQVVNAVLAGNRDDYAKLVDRYAAYTHALAYSYLKDAQAAEDVTQEAFVKAYTALRTLAAPSVFGAWLAQITRNMCRAVLRQRRPETAPLVRAESVPQVATSDEAGRAADRQVREVLHDAMDALSLKLREAAVLFYLKEQPIRDIAQFLGVSENTVKQRLHRARIRLRTHLEEVLKEELAAIRPSSRLTGVVMTAIPVQPHGIGWGAAGLSQLVSWIMLSSWLGPLAIVVLADMVTSSLIMADVKPRYRPMFRRAGRRALWGSVVICLSALVCAMAFADYPWVMASVLLVLCVPLMFAGGGLWLLCPNWRNRVGMVGIFGAIILLCFYLFYPYRQDLWHGMFIAFIVGLWANQSSPFLLAPRKHDEKTPPDLKPVSMQFLTDHAAPFARLLNWHGSWINGVRILSDHVEFTGGLSRSVSWLLAIACLCRPPKYKVKIQLFPDGRVDVDLDMPKGPLAGAGSPEDGRLQTHDYVRRKWAFYVAGDLEGVKAVALQTSPADLFRSAKGRRTLALFFNLLLVGMVVMEGHTLYRDYIQSPALTASRLREFYQGEFLDRARNGFPEEPSTEPNHVPNCRMLLYYRQPPGMMTLPGVAAAYIDLHKKEFQTPAVWNLRYREKQLVYGLEAGYLAVPMLESWGLTREALSSKDADSPSWATLDKEILSGRKKLDSSVLNDVTARVRLLRAMGWLDLMDAHLPDEIVKRMDYRDGIFRCPGQSYGELGITCNVACILNSFNRWDLADRAAVRRWIVKYPSRNRYFCDADQVYHLAVGVLALAAEQELPLSKLAAINRPRINHFDGDSWSVTPFDIDYYAVNDILVSRALLELRFDARR